MKFNNIKALRIDTDAKQEELANLLGISQNSYSRHENGVSAWKDEHLLKLSKRYDVSVDYLMDLKDRDYLDKGKLNNTARDLIENILILKPEEQKRLLALIPRIKNNTK